MLHLVKFCYKVVTLENSFSLVYVLFVQIKDKPLRFVRQLFFSLEDVVLGCIKIIPAHAH